jgi:hypothetical protein
MSDTVTKAEDLAMICPNCHDIIHAKRPVDHCLGRDKDFVRIGAMTDHLSRDAAARICDASASREIMNFDAEFRREDATGATGSAARH